MRTLRRARKEMPAEEAMSLLRQGTHSVLAVPGEEEYPCAIPLRDAYHRQGGYGTDPAAPLNRSGIPDAGMNHSAAVVFRRKENKKPD